MNVIVTIFVPLILGLFMIGYGIRMRMGYYKTWYMKPWVRAGSNIYTLIPVGIMLSLWGVAGILKLLFPGDGIFIVNRIILGIGIVILLVGILLSFIWPSYMKPSWLKWLEREHRDILPLLKDEANAMGYPHWENQVSTQEGLEEWVAEVRRKHGL